MTMAIVIGKNVAFEMSRKMGQEEEPTSSRSYAFACDEHKMMKGKKKSQVQVPQMKKRKKMKMVMKEMIKPLHRPPRTKKQSDASER
jgi:hypothetical protein